ncbi:MAG: cell envelope biogenesis protein AsmA [Burkholderiales bacterium]|nr:MAG: cell envelope biogenesis protein AsmA [Burkholderiales bacterium]
MRAKKLLIGAGAALALLLLAAAVAVRSIDLDRYAALATAKVKEATGRELSIEGRPQFKLSLFPTLVVEGVRFQNARWGSRPDLARVKRLEVRLALLPLLTGDVVLHRLVLIEPDILLETNGKGTGNWVLDVKTPGPPAGEEAKVPPVEIREVRIDRGTLAYRDGRTRRTLRLALEALDFESTSGYQRVQLSARGTYNGVPVALRGEIGNPLAFGEQGALAPLELALTVESARLTAWGTAPLSSQLDGMDLKVQAEVPDLAPIARIAGTGLPRLPPLRLEGRITGNGGRVAVDPFQAAIGKSTLSGTARLALTGERREISVKLSSPLLDLAEIHGARRAIAAKTDREPRARDGRVFPATPFPVAALQALHGDATLEVARLALGEGKTVEGLQARVRFQNGRMVADPVSVRLGASDLRLHLNADAASGKTLAVNGRLEGSGLDMGTLLALAGNPGAVSGSKADVAISLRGSGESLRSLMAGAHGQVRVVLGPGWVKTRALDLGADITELFDALNPARQGEPYTELKCAVVRFPIQQGIARIDNGIALETDKVHVIGGGAINLRDETLDLGFRPKAVTGLRIGAGQLASLVRLGGTLADPRVEADARGVATAAATVGAAILTGGLSLIGQALLLESVPPNPCQVALTGGASKADTQEKPKEGSSTGGPTDFFKRLFGN